MYHDNVSAIKIGDRFFHKFGRGDRLCTAWHLAGAKMYIDNDPEIDKVCDRLKARKLDFCVVDIRVVNDM